MWRAIIADDENIIVNGLKKMIDWEKLGVEIVADACDGLQLKAVIEVENPDIVIADIMMPKMTGLDVIRWYQESNSTAKFIFISGYQEFSYAQEAIKNGAVDYLLKPIGKRELEEAVKKAIGMIKNQSAVNILKEEQNEVQKLFQDINDDRTFENEELYRLFEAEHITFENCFFVGVSVGIRPDVAEELSQTSFERFNLTRFSVYNRMVEAIRGKKNGFVVKKDDSSLNIIGVFPEEHKNDFIEQIILPVCKSVEEACGVPLCVGIGMPTSNPAQLKNVYKTAKFAFELYFFVNEPIINFQNIHKEYTVSFDDYDNRVEQAFRAIIAKDPAVIDKIGRIMDGIESIHYGNRYAAISRTMQFTGELASRLMKYHLLDVDFFDMQDTLQHKAERQKTFQGLRACICEHYENLIPLIYETGKSKDKVLIEKVKNYIREHYAQDLSIKELADISCVSPNYFSAMFKNETGQNYKAYLTAIRMEKALQLLQETDYKTYEIGEKVGYNNVRRFVDAFKQIYGVSPMEYKKALKDS